jgi:hypothetical protein
VSLQAIPLFVGPLTTGSGEPHPGVRFSLVSRRSIDPYRGPVARTRADDACLGALKVHQATNGALARVRLPGGMLTAA